MKFLDQVKIYIKAGNGGNGSPSFRREKFIEFGGPDGGDGGKGGSIILKSERNLNTLIDYRYQQHHKAKRGVDGAGKNKTGKNTGEALVLTISGKLSLIPTLLPRKKMYDSLIDSSVTRIEVVEDGIGDFCGFEVDGNNRFILGKDATITHNCNQTGRTVIGPDATLKLDELAVPHEMADITNNKSLKCCTRFRFSSLENVNHSGRNFSPLN